jgi:hypothetical protein
LSCNDFNNQDSLTGKSVLRELFLRKQPSVTSVTLDPTMGRDDKKEVGFGLI